MSDTAERVRRQSIPTPQFAELWNKSESLADFCQTTGMDEKSASSRASLLRKKKGLTNLKKHQRSSGSGTRLDYAAINASLAVAQESNEATSESENGG